MLSRSPGRKPQRSRSGRAASDCNAANRKWGPESCSMMKLTDRSQKLQTPSKRTTAGARDSIGGGVVTESFGALVGTDAGEGRVLLRLLQPVDLSRVHAHRGALPRARRRARMETHPRRRYLQYREPFGLRIARAAGSGQGPLHGQGPEGLGRLLLSDDPLPAVGVSGELGQI